MPKFNVQFLVISGAIALLALYSLFHYFSSVSSNSNETNLPTIIESTTLSEQSHPILGRSKQEISRLFPGNCFAEIYLRNPSFGGNLIESCKQKTVEQIRSLTGKEIDKSELTSTEVLSHLKTAYGANNPWRL